MPTIILNYGGPDEVAVDVPDGYELVTTEERARLRMAAEILSDLDRSAAGRHRGDVESQDPSGVSQGNKLLPPGTHIGHTMDGQRIVVPERTRRIADWVEAPTSRAAGKSAEGPIETSKARNEQPSCWCDAGEPGDCHDWLPDIGCPEDAPTARAISGSDGGPE